MMSEATDLAHRALVIYRNYPDHVKARQQSQILKQLAEHVLRLESLINDQGRGEVKVIDGKQ